MRCPVHGEKIKYWKPFHWPFPPAGVCPVCWYSFARFIPLKEQ